MYQSLGMPNRRLHQMRAHKSYLAAHPSWWSEDPDCSCPSCRSDDETFEHAILYCPAKSDHTRRYLEPDLLLQAESPLWDNKEHLHALSQYLSASRTGVSPRNGSLLLILPNLRPDPPLLPRLNLLLDFLVISSLV